MKVGDLRAGDVIDTEFEDGAGKPVLVDVIHVEDLGHKVRITTGGGCCGAFLKHIEFKVIRKKEEVPNGSKEDRSEEESRTQGSQAGVTRSEGENEVEQR